MANNANNIKLSACYVRWGGRDLGLTKGGVDVTIKTSTKMVQVDQFGASTVNEYITGREVNVKTPFAETDIDTLYSLTRTAGANFNDNGTIATGTWTFSVKPAQGDTIVVNGHTFTYVTVLSSSNPTDQILIPATQGAYPSILWACLVNTVQVLNLSNDPNVLAAFYSNTGTTVTANYYRSGVIGNSFTMGENSSAITASGATLAGGTDGTVRNVALATGIGISLLTTALPLVLHPNNKPDGDTSEDFIVPLANTPANITFAYKFDNERVFTCEFTGYPNLSTGALCSYGH